MAITVTYLIPSHLPTVEDMLRHDWNGAILVADIDADSSGDVVVVHNLNLPVGVDPFVTLTQRVVADGTSFPIAFCVTNFGANDITIHVSDRDGIVCGLRVYITRPTP